MSYLGQTRGLDSRITSSSTLEDIRGFCQSDIASGSPNSVACNQLSISASNEENASLCQQGVQQACQIAGIPVSTPEELAARAAEREQQAQTERAHIASKIENTCDLFRNPLACFQIAQAARTNQDIVYAQNLEQAEKVIREEGKRQGLPENQINKMVNESRKEFEKIRWNARIFELNKPWHKRKWVWASGILLVTFTYFLFKP